MKSELSFLFFALCVAGCSANTDPQSEDGDEAVATTSESLVNAWIGPVSEEAGAQGKLCGSPGVGATFAFCGGSYCDDMWLFCGGLPAGFSTTGVDRGWTGYTSEEYAGVLCPAGSIVDGIRATGSYADNVSLHCTGVTAPSQGMKCRWTPWFSEEQGTQDFTDSFSGVASGVRCNGSYCDAMSYYVCEPLCASTADCNNGNASGPNRCTAGTCTCPDPGPNQVVVYENENFTGKCATLEVGFVNLPTASTPHFPNKALSSLKVGWGVRAVLYENLNGKFSRRGYIANFEGAGSYASVGNVANRTSSILVDANDGHRAATRYITNYPWNYSNFWSEEAQGTAHDATSIYLAQNEPYPRVLKIPLTHALASSNLPPNTPIASIPADMAPLYQAEPNGTVRYLRNGYDHVGDPDVSGEFLFVPLSAHPRVVGGVAVTLPGLIAVYRTSDMSFVTSDIAYWEPPGAGIGWLSVDTQRSLLYTSSNVIDASHPLEVYWLDRNALRPNGGWFLGDHPGLSLTDRDGLPSDLRNMQGGDVSDDGTLIYLANGYGGDHGGDDWGLRAYNTVTGAVEVVSSNGYGPFNFQWSDGAPWQEPEGVDYGYFASPNVPSDSFLHVVLLSNGAISDGVYMKHYAF